MGEGAEAYDSGLGLTQFTRRIEFQNNSGLMIHDTIATQGKHNYTEALHADASIHQQNARTFLLKPVGDISASLTAVVLAPSDAKSQIEPNMVMGPGIPGSVDKGKLEQRGERLLVNTAAPTSSAVFDWNLKL